MDQSPKEFKMEVEDCVTDDGKQNKNDRNEKVEKQESIHQLGEHGSASLGPVRKMEEEGLAQNSLDRSIRNKARNEQEVIENICRPRGRPRKIRNSTIGSGRLAPSLSNKNNQVDVPKLKKIDPTLAYPDGYIPCSEKGPERADSPQEECMTRSRRLSLRKRKVMDSSSFMNVVGSDEDFSEGEIELSKFMDVELREDDEFSGSEMSEPNNEKDKTLLTLKMIAEILETTVGELNVPQWEKILRNKPDMKILKDLFYFGSKKRRFKCYRCEQQVHGNPKDLADHLRTIHNAPLFFACFFCPLVRESPEELRRHENLHFYPNQTLVCLICDASHFQRISGLEETDFREIHLSLHSHLEVLSSFGPEDQVKECLRCNGSNCSRKPYNSRSLFLKHLFKSHIECNMPCATCGTPINRWKMRQHQLICDPEKDRRSPLQCKECGARFKMPISLLRHDCKGKHVCDICGAKFVMRGSLARHKKCVHGSRQHICCQCGKSFKESKVLEDHMNTHTGEKPHLCLACGTRHTSHAGLAMHLRSRHDLTITQMRKKYQDCPVPDGSEDPGISESDPKVNEINTAINSYTGRKRGRPANREKPASQIKKIRKPRVRISSEDDHSLSGNISLASLWWPELDHDPNAC